LRSFEGRTGRTISTVGTSWSEIGLVRAAGAVGQAGARGSSKNNRNSRSDRNSSDHGQRAPEPRNIMFPGSGALCALKFCMLWSFGISIPEIPQARHETNQTKPEPSRPGALKQPRNQRAAFCARVRISSSARPVSLTIMGMASPSRSMATARVLLRSLQPSLWPSMRPSFLHCSP